MLAGPVAQFVATGVVFALYVRNGSGMLGALAFSSFVTQLLFNLLAEGGDGGRTAATWWPDPRRDRTGKARLTRALIALVHLTLIAVAVVLPAFILIHSG
jgi:hypothetical protein